MGYSNYTEILTTHVPENVRSVDIKTDIPKSSEMEIYFRNSSDNKRFEVLNTFCGSPFWDTNLTWNTADPEFTQCFEKTVLVWIPCFFLWLFSALEAYYILKSSKRKIPWNWLNLTKLGITATLIILTICDIVTSFKIAATRNTAMFDVDIYSPLLKIFTFVLSGFLVVFNRKYGLHTSGILFLFWFISALFGIPQFRSEIWNSHKKISLNYYFHISYLIYYPLVCLMFLLNCLADQSPKERKYPHSDRPCPEESASFLSRLFFSWLDLLIWKGFKKPLETKDLWDNNIENSSRELVPKFENAWQEALRKHESTSNHTTYSKSDPNNVECVINKKKKTASIVSPLITCFGTSCLFGSFLELLMIVLTFVNPQILSLLILYVQNDAPIWKGFLYAVLLYATALAETLCTSHFYMKMNVIGMRIRCVLVSAIYRKALKISNSVRKETTVGEIVNLMAVDSEEFEHIAHDITWLWSAPLQLGLAIYFLWQELGVSVLGGLSLMVIFIPLNSIISNRVKNVRVKLMNKKDERVKMMNEILNGIKVLKLYAWEPSFEEQVLKIRNNEVKLLRRTAYWNSGMSFIWTCAPFLVTLFTFATYVLVDEKHVLDANKAYVSLSLFNILKFPMGGLPMTISHLVQAWVSVKRINKFMNAEELDPNNVYHVPSEDPLIIENGKFSWGDKPVLKNINLRIKKKSLTAVVGMVGAGKSSLVSAFLGEMDKISGRVNTYGKVAFVSQQAWIQHATLRDNILFGKPFNKTLYDDVIESCALKPDLEILPAGDQTEIGEKGINLSGGQKQRVSLARAVYSNADIYFLDDPLSAVDSHVGKHIFDRVIGSSGLLKNKTRLLVTHGIHYLPKTDDIIVLKNGEVSERGTYVELKERKEAFAEFLLLHSTKETENEEEENQRQLKRQRSHISESEIVFEHLRGSSLLRLNSTDKSVLKPLLEEFKMSTNGKKLIEAENAETGNVGWNVYKHYFKSIGLGYTLATVVLYFIYNAVGIGSNVWLGIWADDTSTDSNTGDMYLGVYAALGIGQAIGTIIAEITLSLGTLIAAVAVHQSLLKGVLRSPMTFFDTNPLGRILSRFSKDVEIVDSELPWYVSDGILCIFEVVGTLVVISYTTPLFISVIIPLSVIYYFIQRFFIATSRQIKRLESISRSPIYSHFGESVSGAHTIRAYNEQSRFIRESEQNVDLNIRCSYPSLVANRWLAIRLGMVGDLVIFFAAVFAVIEKNQSPALVGLSVMYSLDITQSLNWLVRMVCDLEAHIIAVERIKEYSENCLEADWEIPNKNIPSSWPEVGNVSFKKYSLRYRPGLDLVLKDVDFEIKGGERVGIVGRTGAGKSSLTLALFRIIEAAKGNIIIDGVKIDELGLHTLRSRLTIIPQDAVLFSGSLRLNLDPFNKHNDESIWKSLEQAHLKEFVNGLSGGLNHEVSEGGENYSVGQRQLICLARALLRKSKILILDEATAAVDLETDELIQATIRTEFKNCTVLTIAHRLNTIMDYDKIIVLRKGDIAEFDTPANLLSNTESEFYSLSVGAGLA